MRCGYVRRAWYAGSAKGTYLRLQPQEYTFCYRLDTGAQSVRFAKIEFSPSIAGEGEYANDTCVFEGGAAAGTVIQMTFRPVETVYTFTMPAAAVQLTTKTYAAHNVAVASCKHGRIAAERALAYADDSVRVTVFPESGYQLSAMTATADNGSVLQPQKNEDGSYSFVMPDCAVANAAAFEAVKLGGGSWNDDETPEPTAAPKPARTAPGENLLYAEYLGTGGELNVVFDGENSPADYELGVLASGEAQEGSVIVRTLPDAIGAAVRRSLILSAAQLTRLAQADEFISAKADGYETPVTERGLSFSGGQKQRLAIARAVAGEAEILIFDDSASALDLKTEANLYAAIDAECPGCTRSIVAQRVASVRRADGIEIS